jgi:glycosyltransferase involved in cell wall biosynthesis
LISDGRPVEHNRIIEEIKKADIALLPYKIDANLKGRIPTKIYEYIAYSLPMITPQNSGWGELIEPINAGITANFNKRKAKSILDNLQKMTFYSKSLSNDIFWECEEDNLLKAINKFI